MSQSPLGLALDNTDSNGSIREMMANWSTQLASLPLPRKKYLFVVDRNGLREKKLKRR